VSNAIKERSARNSESEVNGNQSVSLGRQGGLITSISAPMFPAFKPLPKVFLSIAFRGFLRRTWRLAFCRFFMEEIGGKLSFHDGTLRSPASGAHRILSDAWQKLPLEGRSRLERFCGQTNLTN
jgi:hypothetical protein